MLPMSINQQKHFTSFYARHLQRIYNWHSTSTTLSLSLSPYSWWWLFLFSFSWNCFNKIYFPLCFACAHAFDHSSVPASISHFKHLFVNYFCLVIRPSRTNDCNVHFIRRSTLRMSYARFSSCTTCTLSAMIFPHFVILLTNKNPPEGSTILALP